MKTDSDNTDNFFSHSEFSSKYLYAEPSDEAYKNYINLKKLYIKWNYGLFKSTRYYRNFVTRYLISIIGKRVLTDYNYYLISPEKTDNKHLVCHLYKDRWLQIKGDIKKDDLVGIVRKDPSLLIKWWRSGKMLSIGGRVRDFKLDYDIYGEYIILYLQDIEIKEAGASDITGNN